MNYKITIKSGDIIADLPKDEVDYQIKNHLAYGSVQFLDYASDENGNIYGIRCFADLGHGYGLEGRYQGFTLKFGETYSFDHDYISIDGPTDWNNGSFKVVLTLIKTEN